MKCKRCDNICVKNGKQKNDIQRYYCQNCKLSQQNKYLYKAYIKNTNIKIIKLLKEGCGTRSIARLLEINTSTVTNRIVTIAKDVKKPIVKIGKKYEMDELFTYLKRKKNRICVAYAINKQTKEVVDFTVGKRNKVNLKKVVDTLIMSSAKEIRTDKLNLYKTLIPKSIHLVKQRGINHIERKNLTLRTHIKRLNRKTIAFTRNTLLLTSILKIYFWG